MKMYLISDNVDTWTGMRLAGVEGAVVHEKEELKAELSKVLADKEIGIVLLTEKFGRDFPDLVNDVKLNHKLPLFVEIPDRHGTGRKPDVYKRQSICYLLFLKWWIPAHLSEPRPRFSTFSTSFNPLCHFKICRFIASLSLVVLRRLRVIFVLRSILPHRNAFIITVYAV